MECLNSQAMIDRSDNMEGEGRSQTRVRSGKRAINYQSRSRCNRIVSSVDMGQLEIIKMEKRRRRNVGGRV